VAKRVLRDIPGHGVLSLETNSGHKPLPMNKDKKIMKNTLWMAVVTAGVLTVAASAQAGSPKAEAWAEAHQQAAGNTLDMLDRSVQPTSPKASQIAKAPQKASCCAGPTVDLVHGTRLSPKDPRFDEQLRQTSSIQVAPLK
jgi:hypothetical protein